MQNYRNVIFHVHVGICNQSTTHNYKHSPITHSTLEQLVVYWMDMCITIMLSANTKAVLTYIFGNILHHNHLEQLVQVQGCVRQPTVSSVHGTTAYYNWHMITWSHDLWCSYMYTYQVVSSHSTGEVIHPSRMVAHAHTTFLMVSWPDTCTRSEC